MGPRSGTSGSGFLIPRLLPKAMDLQARILKRVPLEEPEMITSQKQLAASICVQFGEYHQTEKEYDQAVRSYKEALSYSPTDNQVGPSSPEPAPPPVCDPPPRSSGARPLVWGACSSRPQGLPPQSPWSEAGKPLCALPFVEGAVGKMLLKVKLVRRLQVPLGGEVTGSVWLPGALWREAQAERPRKFRVLAPDSMESMLREYMEGLLTGPFSHFTALSRFPVHQVRPCRRRGVRRGPRPRRPSGKGYRQVRSSNTL